VFNKTCFNCVEKAENWICLTCGEFFCSRYVNSHFLAHHLENENHNVCLSMMDLSFWCYNCDCYIVDRVNLILFETFFSKNFYNIFF
jgi:uncharacterized UBP type Zn finger protein